MLKDFAKLEKKCENMAVSDFFPLILYAISVENSRKSNLYRI